MTHAVRLLDAPFSEGLETATSLVRCSKFSAELGLLIRQPGGAERAVSALLREFFPEPQIVRTKQNVNASFSAPIVYVQPQFEELERRFPGHVNPDYKGKRLDPIERCKDVSRENRDVAFEYVHMDRNASTNDVLAEMEREGLRPALYEELLGFAEKYPDERRKYPIVALGSVANVNGRRCVACLWFVGRGRSLRLDWAYSVWHDDCRFLAVRHSTKA